ncbi:MAG: thiol-disulfide oxidoreductase DCC family protein [Bacteroidetes bacterium]|nr:thiol-disulfide oxidoreductase DCC family protein [Bacteroidota bacterium]
MIPANREVPILLFDGVCNLCISVVNFTIKRDPQERFKFAALQSESGQALLKKFGLPTNDFDSFVFIRGEKCFLKSTAALHVLRELGGIWMLFYAFIVFPKPLRDFVYGIVAKRRYRIFGKRNTCIVPTPEVRRRFLQ